MNDIETLKHLVDYGVIALLVLMNFVALFFFIERIIFYRKVEIKSYKTKRALEVALTKHLNIIGTIASNAPYIGLLGTVLAIMLTFMNMGNANDIDAGKIMESLALALKVTAVGLVVAILSMVFYNILSRSAEVLESEYEVTEV
ncbi:MULTISPECIES: TonB-system energizer ExbB [Arcobacteraceae]|uniref:Biopolymer transport protein ExbB n=1 Tax=Aliarcobacter thereius LMG 24486 TaxID=1032240 RepID=A0A1C7WS55_9BACT|nr:MULTISPECIES: TonB-system energizer ExbB [Arcobacteraceae]OCL81858.1 Biopolymer transport protein ExbB [Arcobacter porcinus]OCL87167.1 Biopolymer transport protein ExbB [Arcobacter porcinus]OCL96448.1 Biopolymer transport protein ExbB [Aliarcobacter thereius LMG 24486]QBF15591.1 TonB system transport protein ExbB [Aliarcobacter thereius LMG 24486]TLS91686.1 TonB-system energizer ExbB [Aliarcobacter thereius]